MFEIWCKRLNHPPFGIITLSFVFSILQKCDAILTELWAQDESYPFARPVDKRQVISSSVIYLFHFHLFIRLLPLKLETTNQPITWFKYQAQSLRATKGMLPLALFRVTEGISCCSCLWSLLINQATNSLTLILRDATHIWILNTQNSRVSRIESRTRERDCQLLTGTVLVWISFWYQLWLLHVQFPALSPNYIAQ